VINSAIDSGTHGPFMGTKSITAASDSTIRYSPRVLYTYRVGDKDYQSERVYYGGVETYNAADINSIISGLQPGMSISVYTNPHNPSESYIYNGTKSYTGIIISIILILIAIGIVYQHNVNHKDLIPEFNKSFETSETSVIPPSTRIVRRYPNTTIGTRGVYSTTNPRKTFW